MDINYKILNGNLTHGNIYMMQPKGYKNNKHKSLVANFKRPYIASTKFNELGMRE
jgi:hypothetical protein